MEKKQNLWLALSLCLLILLVGGVAQFFLIYLTEAFSNLTIAINLLICVSACTVYLKFYNKKYWLAIILVVLFSFVFNIIATFLADALILAKAFPELTFSHCLSQMLYAIFNPELVTDPFKAQVLIQALNHDIGFCAIYTGIAVVVGVIMIIIQIVKAKKIAKQNAELQEQSNSYNPEMASSVYREQEVTQQNYNQLFNQVYYIVQTYMQTKDKEMFHYNLSDFKMNYFYYLTESEKQQFKNYANQFINSSDAYASKTSQVVQKL